MGGLSQAQGHAQFVADIADFGMNPQAALEAPRFTKMTFAGNDVEIESRIPEDARIALKAMGHEIKVLGPFAQDVGGGQAVMRDFAGGINYGASDPRKGRRHPRADKWTVSRGGASGFEPVQSTAQTSHPN